jgi:hypothetical protein
MNTFLPALLTPDECAPGCAILLVPLTSTYGRTLAF